jgi:hypothetical protein
MTVQLRALNQEVCMFALVDWFHAAFNRCNGEQTSTCAEPMTFIAHAYNALVAITQNQFDTPPPLHCFDADLQNPADLKLLPLEVPTIDSHIKQLLRGEVGAP